MASSYLLFSALVAVVFVGCAAQSCNRQEDDQPTIIDGESVYDRTEVPWLVRFRCTRRAYATTNEYCAGVLISNTHILTSANCLYVVSTASYFTGRRGRGPTTADHRVASDCDVVLGDLNVRNNEGTEETRHCEDDDIYPHEHYDPQSDNQFNDIGMLRIEAVTVRAEINVISSTYIPPTEDRVVHMYGWGTTSRGGSSYQLQTGETKIRNNEICDDNWNCPDQAIKFDPDQQCCYAGDGGPVTCTGDEGGPVVYGTGASAQLVAINSFSRVGPYDGCSSKGVRLLNYLTSFFVRQSDVCNRNTPAVGTTVIEYTTWIATTKAKLS